mmetsp:Transcript_85320/g.265185  ORF Transcript_85320/g.265185 Transcript_85320/m.265185 type:complete len:202 (+) Transcript_85320:266-871(+)
MVQPDLRGAAKDRARGVQHGLGAHTDDVEVAATDEAGRNVRPREERDRALHGSGLLLPLWQQQQRVLHVGAVPLAAGVDHYDRLLHRAVGQALQHLQEVLRLEPAQGLRRVEGRAAQQSPRVKLHRRAQRPRGVHTIAQLRADLRAVHQQLGPPRPLVERHQLERVAEEAKGVLQPAGREGLGRLQLQSVPVSVGRLGSLL